MTSPLENADAIAKAALEELGRLPDLQSIMVSRTSLRELAESYLYIRRLDSNQDREPEDR